MRDGEPRARIDALVRTLSAEVLSIESSATMRVPSASPVATTTLPKLDVATDPDPTQRGRAELELVSMLGAGGMGQVWLARQRSLDRDVAIKRLGGEAWSATDAAALLVEARATGALEHPGIVPVHALGVASDGSPMLVMKRVDGTTLEALLADPDHAAWASLERRHGDRLVACIEILSRVADALELAHARGWIHRDIKPANVMVGTFGETYLLDWGVAIRIEAVSSVGSSIVGTPAFMAPEMLSEGATPIDARTDVYLLGATLHTVLTRKPRHPGETIQAVLLSAMLSEPPTYEANVPSELADLARRTTAREPTDRPPTAAAFRDALAEFLRHRGSTRLTEQIDRQLDAIGDAASAATAKTITEARFGLAHALREWPGNLAARRALDRTLRLAIEVELARGSPVAAAAIFAELAAPDASLRERIEALREDDEQTEALAAHARREAIERDPTVEGHARAFFFGFLTLASFVVIGAYVSFGPGLNDLRSSFAADVAQFVVLLGILRLFRRRLLANRFGRRAILALVVAAVVATVSGATLILRGGTLGEMFVERNLIFGAVFGMAGAETTRALWVAAAFALVAAIVGSLVPSLAAPLTLVTAVLAVAVVVWKSTRAPSASA
jgi:serine/threonine-protein kinase